MTGLDLPPTHHRHRGSAHRHRASHLGAFSDVQSGRSCQKAAQTLFFVFFSGGGGFCASDDLMSGHFCLPLLFSGLGILKRKREKDDVLASRIKRMFIFFSIRILEVS